MQKMIPGANELLVTGAAATEERPSLSRHYLLPILAFGFVYLLIFCQAIPTFIDEAYSFNLATDKSFSHMLSALRDGADGSFPLYALLVFGWEKLFGSSELSLRLNSGIFVILFVWHSSRRLAGYFGSAVATLAILFALTEANFTYYTLQARFYGLVFFLFSLCFWSTWDLIQSPIDCRRQQVRHAFLCGLLCLSHPLGLVYTGILCGLFFIFSTALKRFSALNALMFLGGPILFLIWLPSFLHQRLVNPTYDAHLAVAGWSKYWRFAFFNSKLLFATCVVGLLIRAHSLFKSARTQTLSYIGSSPRWDLDQRSKILLTLYSVAFIVALNGAIAVLDAIRILPVYWMNAVRYLLVAWAPYCVIVAAILGSATRVLHRDTSRNHWSGKLAFLTVLVGLFMLMGTYWDGWRKDRAKERAELEEVSKTANQRHLTVVCDDHWDAFFLATRTPTDKVVYLLDEDFPFARLLLQASKYYPRPVPLYPFKSNVRLSEQLHSTDDFLFLRRLPREVKIITPGKQ